MASKLKSASGLFPIVLALALASVAQMLVYRVDSEWGRSKD